MNKQDYAKMQAELASLRAENEALKNPPKKERTLTCKVSVKGAVSVYGLGKFPVTLFKGQWTKLLAFIPELQQFITTNDQFLSVKPGKSETQIVTTQDVANITQHEVPAIPQSNGGEAA